MTCRTGRHCCVLKSDVIRMNKRLTETAGPTPSPNFWHRALDLKHVLLTLDADPSTNIVDVMAILYHVFRVQFQCNQVSFTFWRQF